MPDAVTTTLVLIRHAESDARQRLCGSFDAPLSAAGRAQVERLCRRAAARSRPAALYASTLTRARDVAVALASLWHIEPALDDAVREIHCGTFEGMHLHEIQRQYPELWARNEAQADDDFAWPGGESYAAFRARTIAGISRIASRHPGQRVAIVTHAGVISQVLGTIKGRPAAAWEHDRPQPLTATEVAWANGGPLAVLSYNEPDWY